VTVQAMAQACGRCLGGITGSNSVGGTGACLLCVCCVLETSGLCYGLITRPEECYRPRARARVCEHN